MQLIIGTSNFYNCIRIEGVNVKKIKQGKLEIFASKKDTINRLMQLQGLCKDVKDSNDGLINFYCNKKGKIKIECYEKRLKLNFKNSRILSKLYGAVTEYNHQTYIEYFTSLKISSIFARISFFLIAIVILALFLLLPVDKIKVLIVIVCLIIALIFQVISILKEKSNPHMNSETLIKVLEDKVNIINNWEK